MSVLWSNIPENLGPVPKFPHVQNFQKTDCGMMTIAGPCSIEDMQQMKDIGVVLRKDGVNYFRGGVYKAGTYPKDEYPMINTDKLFIVDKIRKEYGLKYITEIMDEKHLDILDSHCDAYQIGARHMQDYFLLNALAKQDKPVFLKRNMGATLHEFLGAAEYLCRHKTNIFLIERGSSSFMDHVRWELSVSVIAEIKRICGIPILVDASHGSGRRELVEPLTLAGIAAGADGFMCEIHPTPDASLTDARQAIALDEFSLLIEKVKFMYQLIRSFGNFGIRSVSDIVKVTWTGTDVINKDIEVEEKTS